jgi:arylsulfatase A-like enzyme
VPEICSRLSVRDILVLSVWCGLAAGLLEVAARVVLRAVNPVDRLYLMSRHFVWVTPLANLVVFVALGVCLAALAWMWPRLGAWLSPRLLCALAILPMLLVANFQIYPEAWMLLSLGIGFRLVSWLARRPGNRWRYMIWSLPALLGLVVILAGSVYIGDWIKERREAGRALPPDGSPNVLFIVLDTVRADRLSLYGYARATTPTLERLGKRGIRFDAARATAPWTLASHASFFSGRWPQELGVQWESPLPANHFPMLAEYLGARGYATAGLVANSRYCSYDSGLDRGFTHYEDYEFEKLGFLRTAAIVERARKTAVIFIPWFFGRDPGWLHSAKETLATWSGYAYRRDAGSVNRGFLTWLDRRHDRQRPFFAFVNYFDAHAPYKLPSAATPRFSRTPQSIDEIQFIYDDWTSIDKLKLAPYFLKLARDSYDNCLAYLDEMLGQLVDDLRRRALLETTWVVIVGDHGEGLGEHDLYDHGESLYTTEIRVPLLIVPPAASSQPERAVSRTVSLRDLPATIADVVGLGPGAPFHGRSLASLWGRSSAPAEPDDVREVLSELTGPNRGNPNQGRSPAHRGPLVSLAEDELVYIRNDDDGTEELFNERDDPRELTNLASRHAMSADLERFRKRLTRLRAGFGIVASSR